MKRIIHLRVNGDDYEVAVKPNEFLVEVLREKVGLTGTKRACDTGRCGACTVIMDGKAVRSCLVLAISADHTEIVTVEGLSKDGHLHKIQRSFVEHGAIQCGFCTPGMIMLTKALLDENPHPNREEIKAALASNICRCTGYVKIIEAVEAVVRGDFDDEVTSGG